MAGIPEVAKGASVSEDVVKAVFDSVLSNSIKGGTVMIKGFGTFKVKERPARECFNPQNPKQKVSVPAKNVLVFHQSANLELGKSK